MKKLLNSWISKVLTIALVITAMGIQAPAAFAASISEASDNMSRLKINEGADHEIIFQTPSGIGAGDTMTFTFASGFVLTGVDDGDIDLETSANPCASASFTAETVSATASGATWGAVAAGQVLTITSGSDTLAANGCVRILIGTNASGGTNQITNPSSANSYDIDIAGTFGDIGTINVAILADDQVVITATLGPSISFAISDNAIDFGALSNTQTKWATSGAGGATTATSAHNLTASTNASGGYVIYMQGPLLTSGSDNIDSIGTTATAPAAAGTAEQFGVRFDASGGTAATVSAPYATAGQYAYDAVSAPDEIATATGASATTTYSAYYVANVDNNTAAGNYSTTLTYTATATF